MVSKGMKWEGPPKNQGSKIHVQPLIWGAKWRFQNLQKSVPRYSTSGAEDEKFGFQDAFNPFYASRFSTYAFVPCKSSHGFVPFGEFFRVLWTRYGSSMCLCDHLCHGILQPGQLHGTQEVPTRKISEFLSVLQILSSRVNVMNFTFYMRCIFLDSFFLKNSTTNQRETAKNGDHQMVLILGKSNNANGYGKFEGCPP